MKNLDRMLKGEEPMFMPQQCFDLSMMLCCLEAHGLYIVNHSHPTLKLVQSMDETTTYLVFLAICSSLVWVTGPLHYFNDPFLWLLHISN